MSGQGAQSAAKKRLYLVGGAMGVGKTAACRALQNLLPRCVFLDADWLWDAKPFTVTGETRAMVLDNIAHCLNNFLSCSAYENIVFCWVLDRPEIWQAVESGLRPHGAQVVRIALTCAPETLAERLGRDLEAGVRTPDVLPRSLRRLPLFEALPGVTLLRTDGLTPRSVARRMAACAR